MLKILNTYVLTNTFIGVFLAVLFIKAKVWKQLQCPLIDGWINKIWYSHTMEHYLTMK